MSEFLALSTPEKEITHTREIQESRPRYVIYFGECFRNKISLPKNEFRFNITEIPRCKVVQVTNSAYWDRDQDDRDTPLLPSRNREHLREVRVTLRAAGITEYLMRQWSHRGLVHLEDFIDVNVSTITEVVSNLFAGNTLPQLSIMSIPELRTLIDKNTRNAINSNIFPELTESISAAMIQGLDKAENYCYQHLSSLKGEMEDRRSSGFGIAKLDDSARRMLTLIGRPAADYEVDGQSLQQALVNQMIQIRQPQNDVNSMATTIAAVLQQLNIAPQPAPVVTPPVPVIPYNDDDEPVQDIPQEVVSKVVKKK